MTTSFSPVNLRALGLVASVGATIALGANHPAAAAPAVPFLAHQAAYELSLLKSRRNPAVDGASGRILYSFTGSECEGYTTEFRQVSQVDTEGGKSKVSDMRSTSWEDAAGKTYRFHISTVTDQVETSNVDGYAERTGDTVTIKLKQPSAKTFTISKDIVFPTEQVRRIIDGARAGKSLLELDVYDGSEDGQKIFHTLTVIGQPVSGDRAPSTPDVGSGTDTLKSLTRWPVTVSYYDKAAREDAGEQTPEYAMSFELYENGVSRALKLDFNDFVIGGAMSKFDIKSAKPCK
jgi:envelope integrity protein B